MNPYNQTVYDNIISGVKSSAEVLALLQQVEPYYDAAVRAVRAYAVAWMCGADWLYKVEWGYLTTDLAEHFNKSLPDHLKLYLH